MKSIDINVEGISCLHCIESVTIAVLSIKGVKECNVELLTKKASIVFDDTITNVQNIINKIEDIGFEANI